eukprot:231847_1
MNESLESLQQRISLLEKENTNLRSKLSDLNGKYDQCEQERSHYEHTACGLEEPLLSQQSNSSEYVPSGYKNNNINADGWKNDFYKRIFVLGLRSYVKNAKNISKVMEIMALYFSHMGFDMTGYEDYIISSSSCSEYCRCLSQTVSYVHVAVELFVGWFKGKYLCRFTDGSSFKGVKIETFGVVAYFAKNSYCDYSIDNNEIKITLTWEQIETVNNMDKMNKMQLTTLCKNRNPDINMGRNPTKQSILNNLQKMDIKISTNRLQQLGRESLKTECDLLNIKYPSRNTAGFTNTLLQYIQKKYLQSEPQHKISNPLAYQPKSEFKRVVIGMPQVTGSDQNSLAAPLIETGGVIKKITHDIFGEAVPENYSIFNKMHYQMGDKAPVEKCLMKILSDEKTIDISELECMEPDIKFDCLLHAFNDLAKGMKISLTAFRLSSGDVLFAEG